MNRTTKFTQTKNKEKSPAPEQPSIKRHRKRCAPQPPDGEASEAPASAKFSPPPPLPILKSFLKDLAQEVVEAKPIDVVDHLADYTVRLRAQLRERQSRVDEEYCVQMLMEEKAKQLKKEKHACRVIEMAFRAFKTKREKKKEEDLLHEYVVDGVTIEEANQAATCIQRNFRLHTMKIKVNRKLAMDRIRAEDVLQGIPRQKKGSIKPGNKQRALSNVDDTVKELYGPSTPYKADGEQFGVEDPCPMAAPLLAKKHRRRKTISDDDEGNDIEEPEEYFYHKKDSIKSVPSLTLKTPEETGDSPKVDADTTAPSSGTKVNEEDADEATPPPATEHSSGSVAKVASGEQNEATSEVPEATGELPTVEPTSDEQPESIVAREPPATETPADDINEA